MPKVSICCAYYNRSASLRATLDSLLAQRYDDFEVVLVNDGSKDPAVREILDTYQDPRLRIIHQENAGFVPTIRRAVAEARGDYIAIQGAGDVSLPDRLARQAAVLDADPDVGVVSCRQREVRIGGPKAGPMGLSRLVSLAPDAAVMAGRYAPIIHGEVMFRKSIYERVGGYRPFFVYAQDRDLWLRMAAHSKLMVIDEILYERNHFHDDGVNANPAKVIQQRALALFAVQCHHDRLRLGYDLVERYGVLAPLFRKKDRDFAGFIADRAKDCFLAGDVELARQLADTALWEAWTPKSVVVANLIRLGVRSRPAARAIRLAVAMRRGKRVPA